jgi:O-acetylhomoserine (thiol)-lyase
MHSSDRLASMRRLSPRRNTSTAENVDELVAEQLRHFAIDPQTEFGAILAQISRRMYECQYDVDQLWAVTLQEIGDLEATTHVTRFNAKKFLSFQLAKLLDTVQHPFRRSYQALAMAPATLMAKGPYPIFDNITAIFSATPVITRTATYIYACAEWIEDAFAGKELMLEIYSRLLNPTSICLANYIVDLEAGPFATDYLAWNFNSGMAAIDAALSHVLGREDILITCRNTYGGTHQLIHDWFAKPGNLEIAVEKFDGFGVEDFEKCWQRVKQNYQHRLKSGRRVYVFLESPCNPHGYVLDVPAICKRAHELGMVVMLDATVGTPFLTRPLQQADPQERPDYVIHSYTKDLTGTGSAIAGCVIGRNEDMFIPKGQTMGNKSWQETLFWNVYYVKGAFLNADAAYEVIQGIRTLAVRMLRKCINTTIMAHVLESHPRINVHCHALEKDANFALREKILYLGLPAPLFTADFGAIPRHVFQRFFDALAPVFGHMISLGQSDTIVSCPALTTHSELDAEALAAAGLSPTTVRFAMGVEEPTDLVRHLIAASKATIDPEIPGFSAGFPQGEKLASLIRDSYLRGHAAYIESQIQS